ncbi:MAG: hypothetical protein ACYDAJ_07305 [Nitrosotalea sp.]
MKNEEMIKLIDDELMHIPKVYDSITQAQLRSTYNMSRRHDLTVGKTKEETLASCIESLKKDNPSWEPSYDKNFFNI